MPWTAADVPRHKKGLSAAQRKKWAGIANGVLKSTGNEAEAIRTANSRVQARKRPNSASGRR